MWGISYLYWKLKGGNVVSSLNRTDVESCADSLKVVMSIFNRFFNN